MMFRPSSVGITENMEWFRRGKSVSVRCVFQNNALLIHGKGKISKNFLAAEILAIPRTTPAQNVYEKSHEIVEGN